MSDIDILGNVCESITYGVTASADFGNAKGLKLLRITDITDKGVDWDKVPQCGVAGLDAASCLLDGDIVVARTGGTVGKSFLVSNPPAAVNASYLLRLRPKRSVVEPDYLSLFLGSGLYWSQLYEAARGAAQPNVNATTLAEISLPVPSLPEQRQIAAHLKAQLAEVETARQAAQAQVRESDALRTSIYRDAFRQVAPVIAPPSFPDAPPGWRWRKLAELARLESGHTPSRFRPDWWGGDVSWISLTEIRALDGTWVEQTQLRTNDQGIANSAARILPRGTVCFSRTASVGFVTIMAAPMATSQDFANWVCGDELDSEFLMHALIRSRQELRELATGATHKTIYMPTLESFHLCVPDSAGAPSIEKQRQIAARLKTQLAEASAIAQAAAAQLAEIERLPQKLLAQAFHAQGEVP